MRILPDWIDSFMHLTRDTEAARMFRKWAAVSTVASVLQRKCYLNWGTLTFYPNMYVILTAPSGKRKASAMDIARDWFLDPMHINLAAEAITREALIRELRTTNDTTVDIHTGMMEMHSSLTIHSQELTVFLGYQNHQLMADLCDWFDCRNKWTYRTKTSGTDEIIGVWVNLIGATTPTLIQSTLPLDAFGGGLTSRMIFVYEKRKGKTVIIPILTKEDLKLRDDMVSDLSKIKMLQGRFTVTEDFIEVWSNWYPAQDENPPFKDIKFDGYFERRPTHVMKLSTILNASRTETMIVTGDDLKNAIKLLEETEVNMPYTFSGIGQSSNASLISRIMADIGNCGKMTFEDLMYEYRHDLDKRGLIGILDSIEAMGFCDYVVNTGEVIYVRDDPDEVD